jgi:hypothetical protein
VANHLDIFKKGIEVNDGSILLPDPGSIENVGLN